MISFLIYIVDWWKLRSFLKLWHLSTRKPGFNGYLGGERNIMVRYHRSWESATASSLVRASCCHAHWDRQDPAALLEPSSRFQTNHHPLQWQLSHLLCPLPNKFLLSLNHRTGSSIPCPGWTKLCKLRALYQRIDRGARPTIWSWGCASLQAKIRIVYQKGFLLTRGGWTYS